MADVALLRPRIETTPQLTVNMLSDGHFEPIPGWTLRSDPVIITFTQYTPNEGVRGFGWVALSTRSDRAVSIGGSA
eukprot:3478914-Pleurochrysis_carterae.AAC.1